MRQFTTPTLDLFVKVIDLRGYTVVVTVRQGNTIVNVENPTIEYIGENTTMPGSLISAEFTQAQTGAFCAGTADVQINWVDINGKRDATKVKTVMVHENLVAQVIE